MHYLYGNLDYAQGDRDRALADYHDAIRLDAGFRNDAVLRANVRATLDRHDEGPAAVALLADDIGKPALADLVACAKSCRDERTRKQAAEAAIKIGGAKLIAAEGKPADDDEPPPRCSSGCARARPAASARRRRSSSSAPATSATSTACAPRAIAAAAFSASSEINGCMRRDLDAAIRKWEP